MDEDTDLIAEVPGVSANDAFYTGGGFDLDTQSTGIAPNDYYLYAIIDDGTNPPVISYSKGALTISDLGMLIQELYDSINDLPLQGGVSTDAMTGLEDAVLDISDGKYNKNKINNAVQMVRDEIEILKGVSIPENVANDFILKADTILSLL